VAQAHRILPPVPIIEISDDADAPRIRRPHGKEYPRDATMSDYLRAEIFFELTISFQCAKRVCIEHAAEGISIIDCANTMMRLDAQPIFGLTIRSEACNE
jgi:hypothetical protein